MPAAHDVRPSSIMGYEANLHPRRQPVATVKPSHDGWSENERLAISSRNEASPSKDRPKRSRCACADTCSSGQGLIVRGLTKVAQRLEAVQIPKRRLACCNQLITKYGTSQLDSSSQQASGEEPSELPEVIPLISGLTPVISGAAPAADTVRIFTIKPPRYIFYSISGFLCDMSSSLSIWPYTLLSLWTIRRRAGPSDLGCPSWSAIRPTDTSPLAPTSVDIGAVWDACTWATRSVLLCRRHSTR